MQVEDSASAESEKVFSLADDVFAWFPSLIGLMLAIQTLNFSPHAPVLS